MENNVHFLEEGNDLIGWEDLTTSEKIYQKAYIANGCLLWCIQYV